MSRLSPRAQFKTWHFTSVLRPCREITGVLRGFANDSQYTDKVTSPIAEVRNWVQNLVLNTDKPDSVSFISLRFSRTDVATWMSNATTFIPLLDLHFERYIQSNIAIELPRLDQWIPEAIWNSVGGKLSQSNEYNLFSRANEVYEYLNSGSLAANKGGRPSKGGQPTAKPSVRPDLCIQHLGFPIFPPVAP